MTALRPQAHPVFTDEDYLRFERFSQERHEFLDGSVYAMAGESPNHSTICFNLNGAIYSQLRGKQCRGFSPNMKVATSDADLYSYPDLVIVCGEVRFRDETADVIANPTVIFEVLSPSTESYDRGEKFLRYTNNISSLQEYILVSQTESHVERYSRSTGWKKEEIDGLEAVLLLNVVECELSLAELYDRVEFPA